jgi:hypothetical protein
MDASREGRHAGLDDVSHPGTDRDRGVFYVSSVEVIESTMRNGTATEALRDFSIDAGKLPIFLGR